METLFKHAKAEETPAIAKTDTNNLFGGLEFFEKAANAGVQPLIGAHLTVYFDDAPVGGFSRMAGRHGVRASIVLIAEDERG